MEKVNSREGGLALERNLTELPSIDSSITWRKSHS